VSARQPDTATPHKPPSAERQLSHLPRPRLDLFDALVVFLVRLFCGTNVHFLHEVDDQRPRIYFANHSSLLDFVVIWSVLPRAQRAITRPAAARDYWDANFIRRFFAVTVFKATLIERRHPTREHNPLQDMLRVLEQGRSLIIFPEGTRGSGDEVAEFQAGLFHVCTERPDVEAIPIYLDNLNRILPKGEIVPLPLLSRAIFGVPFSLQAGESRDEFLKRARLAVLALGNA
jgi:1-acyl-sn-glycerol-3-phosphate acyltransferase